MAKNTYTFVPLEVQTLLKQAHESKQTVVLVTGVFDLLHEEHRLFLQKAAAIGDVLIVALESDIRVRQIKGEGRPIHSAPARKAALEALHIAQAVFILPDEFSRPEHHEQLIDEVRPRFLAVSSHTAHQDKKAEILKKFGGELRVVHEHNPAVSSTLLLLRRQQKN